MSFKVEFTRVEDGEPDFAHFAELEWAHEFVKSRPSDYGKDFIIIDEDTGKLVK